MDVRHASERSSAPICVGKAVRARPEQPPREDQPGVEDLDMKRAPWPGEVGSKSFIPPRDERVRSSAPRRLVDRRNVHDDETARSRLAQRLGQVGDDRKLAVEQSVGVVRRLLLQGERLFLVGNLREPRLFWPFHRLCQNLRGRVGLATIPWSVVGRQTSHRCNVPKKSGQPT